MAKKNTRKSIPGLTPLARNGYRGVRLIPDVSKLKLQVTELAENISGVKKDYLDFKKNTLDHRDILGDHLHAVDKRMSTILSKLEEVGHQVALIEHAENAQSKKISTPAGPARVADDHALDDFYVQFENKYRGSEEVIKERQQQYMPYISKALKQSNKKSKLVIDIGCGRGEFLEIIKENKLEAFGLDLNGSMVEEVEKKGMSASQDDALTYLLKQKSNTALAITGFQIVEHIPFNELIRILAECHRVLTPGGIIIFETPNPENIVVSAHTFRYDPSHLQPLPPNLLSFMVETRGFTDIEVLRLHGIETNESLATTPLLKELSDLIHGPRDYSVIATKPLR